MITTVRHRDSWALVATLVALGLAALTGCSDSEATVRTAVAGTTAVRPVAGSSIRAVAKSPGWSSPRVFGTIASTTSDRA